MADLDRRHFAGTEEQLVGHGPGERLASIVIGYLFVKSSAATLHHAASDGRCCWASDRILQHASTRLDDMDRWDRTEPFGTSAFDLRGQLEQQVFPAETSVKLDADWQAISIQPGRH